MPEAMLGDPRRRRPARAVPAVAVAARAVPSCAVPSRAVPSRAVPVLIRVCALALALGTLSAWAPAAGARTPWHACGNAGRRQCARVSVPVDRSGRVPGRISLAVERYAAVPHPHGTLLALPGGPGQSGVALLGPFRAALHTVLGDRALVVFDERGIGRSGPLTCRVSSSAGPAGRQLTACARRLGPRARFYSTADTVADIEAVRRTLHLGRLDIYSASYGTFAATQYARRHPSRLAHLVLDSTLPADGDPDVKLNSLVSIRRQLASLCPVVCPALDPARDIGALLARLVTKPLPPQPDGPFSALTEGQAEKILYRTLFASDLDPFIRASIPATLAQAVAGGGSSGLYRLGVLALADSLTQTQAEGVAHAARLRAAAVAAAAHPRGELANVEGVATRCEDERFVWATRDSLAVRRAKVRQERSLLPAGAVAPFSAATAVGEAGIGDCEHWPYAGLHPRRQAGPLPAVPTLILSGENDVRTPLEQAAVLAAQIPGATLLAVPNAGHSVIVDDHSGCALKALDAFFAGAPVLPCPAQRPPPVDPPVPALAALAPAAPLAGEPGRVLTGSVLTLRHDAGFTQGFAEVLGAIPGTAGGLFAVSARAGHAVVVLTDLSYVPGLALSGTLRIGKRVATGRLRVTLAGAAYGTLDLARDATITGTLGGLAFSLTAAQRQAIDTAGGLDFITQLG